MMFSSKQERDAVKDCSVVDMRRERGPLCAMIFGYSIAAGILIYGGGFAGYSFFSRI
jgi:hypothetical protein